MNTAFKIIWRTGAAILALAVVLAAVWFVRLQFGWVTPPADAPFTAELYDSRYADAADAAGEALAAMRARTGVPGASAAVSIDGRLVWAAGAGFADIHTLEPVTPQTSFRIGSTSKAMTATVIARLAADGVLDLDDRVGEHWSAPLNPDWAPLTLRRLMSHTAGMPGYENNTDYLGLIGTLRMQHRFDSVEDGLSLVDGSRLAYEPGEDFFYSSFDVNLAARVAEAAGGRSYGDLLAERVTRPLGLETPYLADHGAKPAREASWHQLDRGRARIHPRTDVSQRWPGGGLAARSSDLVQVAGAWLDENFIPRRLAEDFWTPVRLNDGTVNEQNYAVGWRSDRVTTRFGADAPVRMVHHGGVSRGAMSWLALYPDLGIAVAVNINAETLEFSDFASVEPEILRLFAEAAGRTPPDAAPPG
ncbi:MAG: serine hydrolase domain-containing protein [Oceanicaulis sp.]